MKKLTSLLLSLVMVCTVFSVFSITSEAAGVNIKYSVHLANSGWQNWVTNGKSAGTTGKSKRIEAMKINVSGVKGGTVTYRTHIQGRGWQNWTSAGKVSGTTGKSLRAEAVQIKLTGNYAKKYDVVYRVHVQNFGWLAWTKNGATAGTTGMAYRMEAIQIKLVKKGKTKTTGKAYIKPISVSYSAHVQNIGWQNYVSNGATAGTTGQSKRLEAIKIACKNHKNVGCIKYSAHVQDIGWQEWKSDGSVAGTTGQGKRLEAIKIKLDNSASPYFDVYYRVHISNYGWLGWAKNGQEAGSTGLSIPIEAIEIKVVSNACSISTGGKAFLTQADIAITNGKIYDFINSPNWANGASWGNKAPDISSYKCEGCCAYCADYAKYCYNNNSPRGGAPFYNINEIRAGDVVIIGNGSNGKGHWFVVVERKGNNLLVAEGNVAGKVRVGWNYTISANRFTNDSRAFTEGYHFI